MPAPVAWALRLLVSYFCEWGYKKLKMEASAVMVRRKRRKVNRGLVRALRSASTDEERRDALDGLARRGLG